MASKIINKTTGAIEIRAYAGKDPVTGQVRNLYRALDPSTDAHDVDVVMAELQEMAYMIKSRKMPFTVEGVVSYYLDYISTDGHSVTTIDAYRSNARCYIYPFIGDVAIDRVQPYTFAALYKRLLESGGKDEHPLSANTVIKLHAWLKAAFDYLKSINLVPDNPLDGVKRPRAMRSEAAPLSELDLREFADYLSAHLDPDASDYNPLDVALYLALNTGVRRGELAGFFVGDFKKTQSVIQVKRTLVYSKGKGLIYKNPKSTSSIRSVSLEKRVAEVLEKHLDFQRKNLSERGVKTSAKTPLFASLEGATFAPRNYNDHLSEIVKYLNLDRSTHLHTLRHTHATYLIESGVNIRTVQERLGHSSVTTTLSIYSHVLPGRDAQAAESFAALLGMV